MSALTISTSFEFRNLVKATLMRIFSCSNTVQIYVLFLPRAFVISRHQWVILQHVQYTRSVTGRKKSDALRRIVTARRLVTTGHDRQGLSRPSHRKSCREKGYRKWTSAGVYLPLIKLTYFDDPRRIAKLARAVTIRDGSWWTVTAVKQPCTLMMSLIQINRTKKCVNIPRFKKGAHKHNKTPKHCHSHETTMHANGESNKNKQGKKVCEYTSF